MASDVSERTGGTIQRGRRNGAKLSGRPIRLPAGGVTVSTRTVPWLAAAALLVAAGTRAPAKEGHAGTSADARPLSAPSLARIDSPVRDFALPNIGEVGPKTVKLSDYRGKTVVAVWMSYTCPLTRSYEERLGKLIAEHGAKGDVVFL